MQATDINNNTNRFEMFFNRFKKPFKFIDFLFKIILIVIILFLLLELFSFFASKIYFNKISKEISVIDEYKSQKWVKQEYLEERQVEKFEYFPYVEYRRIPNFSGLYVNLDNESIRKTIPDCSNNSKKPLKIFVFGGSTMWGSYSKDNGTIPSFLSSYLCKNNIYVKAINFGETGYTNTQELIKLESELRRGNYPDIVIFYDGANDVFTSYQNNEAGFPQNIEHRKKDFNARKRLNIKGYIMDSNLMKIIRRLSGRFFPNKNKEIALKPGLDDDTVKVYLNNARIISALEKEYNFKAFLYWQPSIFTKDIYSEYEKTIVIVPDPMVSPPKELYLNITNKIKGKERINDLSNIFNNKNKTIFIDWCHVTEEGNSIIARSIADDIVNYLNSIEYFKSYGRK
ncbi:MAG: SGNH/GDSL hydrolase family protein [Nanoarchaeota archaeon]|nr:SGNH/GDSL hydrolase family protein [Nanoarchaeota archaeon]